MSRHWNPRDFRVVRGGGGSTRFGAGEIGLVLLIGMLLGLGYAFAPLLWQPEPAADLARLEPRNYYAEAEKSRAILRAQEYAPLPRVEPAKPVLRPAVVGAGDRVDVIDGDTFRLDGATIRIADIDTPETNPPRCAYEAELGERATRRLAALLAQGPFELARIDRDTDRYGRKLRIVTRGGRSIGDQLVAEGLARTWTGRRQPWC